jgi:hypothetical protein
MEAGKERLTRDITRDATRAEIQDIKRENARLKTLVAELDMIRAAFSFCSLISNG